FATQFKEPELFLRLHDVVGKYLDGCNDMPEERKKDLRAIINLPPQREALEVSDGVIIADFYLPYICCSDCPPVAYILAPPVNDSETPILKIAKDSFCNNDSSQYAITINPAGGELTGDGVKRIDGNFVFVPNGLDPGSHTINYTLNQKSASVMVQVTASPI